ncbi:MAG: transposase [Desulfobacterales bacterium]|nr:transposase [Desulfobacterales bacterium]
MGKRNIWALIFPLILSCRSAFKTKISFFWASVVIIGFCMGGDGTGHITGIIRCLDLNPQCYTSALAFFCSGATDLTTLRCLWLSIVLKNFNTFKINGYTLIAIDEIKIGKEGKRMPGVRLTHQSSQNNSKPEFIMGHTIVTFAVIAKNMLGRAMAIPFFSNILGGIRLGPNDRKTCLSQTVDFIEQIKGSFGNRVVFVADALYCVKPFMKPLMERGMQVISRLKITGVGYCLPLPSQQSKRGRKRKYGEKIKLVNLFKKTDLFTTIKSPIPGETCDIRYFQTDLLVKWLGKIVRFVLVSHPVRGNIILVSTDITFSPMDIYMAYYYRFQIELTFKSLKHVLNAFSYQFWTKAMDKIKRGDKDKYTHRLGEVRRKQIMDKIKSYHLYMMLGCISCGLMQFLSLYHPKEVFGSFGGWLRTIRKDQPPSLEVTRKALISEADEFLHGKEIDHEFAKFIDTKRGNQPEKLIEVANM